MAFKAVLFNKPYDVVTQFSKSGDHRTLGDFRMPQGVYPCGRLDRDSEGLLLLINDGKLQNRLTDPKRGHPRTYLVEVEGVPDPERLETLRQGVKLKDGLTRPCEVNVLRRKPDLPARKPPVRYRKNIPTTWLEMTLTEGRNRQVRRMTAAISHPTLRLVRVKIGRLTLEGLEPGQWRFATHAERTGLRGAGFDPEYRPTVVAKRKRRRSNQRWVRTKSRTKSSRKGKSKGRRS